MEILTIAISRSSGGTINLLHDILLSSQLNRSTLHQVLTSAFLLKAGSTRYNQKLRFTPYYDKLAESIEGDGWGCFPVSLLVVRSSHP